MPRTGLTIPIAEAHDVTMPHDMRFGTDSIEGCPPRCPALTIAGVTPHAFVSQHGPGGAPEPRDACVCGRVRAAYVHSVPELVPEFPAPGPGISGSELAGAAVDQLRTTPPRPRPRIAGPGTCKLLTCPGWGLPFESVEHPDDTHDGAPWERRAPIGAPDDFTPYIERANEEIAAAAEATPYVAPELHAQNLLAIEREAQLARTISHVELPRTIASRTVGLLLVAAEELAPANAEEARILADALAVALRPGPELPPRPVGRPQA